MKATDIRRIAERHPDIPQDGFPELEYLTPAPEAKEERDEHPD